MKKIVDKGVDATLALMLVAMTVAVFAQVFFRYVLRSPLSWPEETARMLIVWLSFLGGYMALRERRHIGFSLFVKKLPRGGTFALEVIVLLFMLFFLAVVIREGTYFAQRSLNVRMPYTRISVGWFVYSAFPVSGTLMLIQTAMNLADTVKRFRAGDEIPVETQEEG